MNDKKCKNCKHFKRSDKPWQDEFGHWIYGCCLVDHECMYTYPNRPCVYPDEFKPILTRRERNIQSAIESGQNVEAVIKREDAIEQFEQDIKMRLLGFAG